MIHPPQTKHSIAAAPNSVPTLFRAVAAARRALGDPASAALARSQLARPFRRVLSARAPQGARLVEICGGPLRGTQLKIDLRSEKYYWLGTHERAVQDTIVRTVRSGDAVFDVGAHIGFFSMLAARCAGPTGRVIAFEPLQPNIDRLRDAVVANDVRNIESYCLALSDRAGDELFALHESSLEGLLIGDGALPATHASTISVPTSTIDDLVARGMPAPDLIKIDVEGAEGRVIAGARDTITTHPPALLIEVHSVEAGLSVSDALPVAYRFEDIASGAIATLPLAPGHYLGRPD